MPASAKVRALVVGVEQGERLGAERLVERHQGIKGGAAKPLEIVIAGIRDVASVADEGVCRGACVCLGHRLFGPAGDRATTGAVPFDERYGCLLYTSRCV